MGLDNIVFQYTHEIDDAGDKIYLPMVDDKLASLCQNLIGGIATSDSNSFRGKVYAKLLKEKCFVDLYKSDEWSDHDYAKVVAQMFINDYAEKDYINEYGHTITVQNQINLRKFFSYMLELRNKFGDEIQLGAWY
jgi:hypothetical protein